MLLTIPSLWHHFVGRILESDIALKYSTHLKMHHLLYGHINKIVSKSLNLIIETYFTRISHTHCALSCKNNYCFYLQGVQSLL